MAGLLSPQEVVKMVVEIESKIGRADSMHARLEKLALTKMKNFTEKTGANSVGEIIQRLQVPAIHTVKDAERFVDDIGTIEKAIYGAARDEEKNVTNEYGIVLRKNTGINVMGPVHFHRMCEQNRINPITGNALKPLVDRWTATNNNIDAWVKTEHNKLPLKIQQLKSAQGVFNEKERKQLDELYRLNEINLQNWKREDEQK
jgi:hypothetical protein